MIKFTLPLLLLLPLNACASEAALQADRCSQPGVWLGHDGADGVRQLDPVALLERLAANQAGLLGETHDSAEDHRWQLHTLAQLHAHQPRLAIGFEMFPRRLQPVLDRWVAGELSEAAFLRETDWNRTWGYDARLYLPLFHYARMNRLPMLALNVERSLVSAVDARGWEGVPEAQREGLTRPVAPPEEYRKMLRQVYEHHPEKGRDDAGFERFVQAQTTWDRAMAEGIAAYLKRQPDALVVGIMGAGHVRFGHGVAHQLKDLGVRRVANLVTWDAGAACADFKPGLADAAYVVRAPQTDPPRLGIAMGTATGGVRIAQVTAGSVAERAGLKAGDVVVEAAGVAISSPQIMRQTIERQAPGTWLPLKVRRDGQELEIVARFPPQP
jgi:uncharacterized iron-regulated protein